MEMLRLGEELTAQHLKGNFINQIFGASFLVPVQNKKYLQKVFILITITNKKTFTLRVQFSVKHQILF